MDRLRVVERADVGDHRNLRGPEVGEEAAFKSHQLEKQILPKTKNKTTKTLGCPQPKSINQFNRFSRKFSAPAPSQPARAAPPSPAPGENETNQGPRQVSPRPSASPHSAAGGERGDNPVREAGVRFLVGSAAFRHTPPGRLPGSAARVPASRLPHSRSQRCA